MLGANLPLPSNQLRSVTETLALYFAVGLSLCRQYTKVGGFGRISVAIRNPSLPCRGIVALSSVKDFVVVATLPCFRVGHSFSHGRISMPLDGRCRPGWMGLDCRRVPERISGQATRELLELTRLTASEVSQGRGS